MEENSTIQSILNNISSQSSLIRKEFFIGINEKSLGTILYLDGLVDKTLIDRDILKPLMLNIKENVETLKNPEDFICKKYVTLSNSYVENDFNNIISALKRGKTLFFIDKRPTAIIMDTTSDFHRDIPESQLQISLRGPKEAFIENFEINLSMLKRRLKDSNFIIEKFIIGTRSQTDVVMLYVKGLADENILNNLRFKLNSINVDNIYSSTDIEQYLELNTYSVFPEFYGTEKPDVVQANLCEGRIAILVDGCPYSIICPASFFQFFQSADDYYSRTFVSSFVRVLRLLAAISIIILPSLYITIVKFNVELLPIKFIVPVIQSRAGIALTPFMEILSMQIIIEFLREGGLRLPPKIGQTLGMVGGLIIGDASVKSKIVSPTTLLVVGIWVVCTFLIPNYEMMLSLRILNYLMLFLSNMLGFYGISIFSFVILIQLCSRTSFGMPYLEFVRTNLKDIFVRDALWKMNTRPSDIKNSDLNRQTDFRKNFWRKKEDENS